MSKTPDAWIIPHCPDFYFMPSLFYHKVFKEWDNGTWDCPAYWNNRGIPLIPCYNTAFRVKAKTYLCQDNYGKWDKSCLIKGYNCTTALWNEDLDCAIRRRKSVVLLTFEDFSPINGNRVTGPMPTFRTRSPRDY